MNLTLKDVENLTFMQNLKWLSYKTFIRINKLFIWLGLVRIQL
jgi:hypothetical protein